MLGEFNDLDNMIVILGERREHFYVTTGISFQEFYYALSNPIHHLLLLKHGFKDADLHTTSRFEFVEEESIQYLMEEDISKYSQFSWIDFGEIECLDELEPNEIAALLYLGHMKQPMYGKPLFARLRNKYAYFSSKDDNDTKVYYRYVQDFIYMLCNAIPNKLNKQYKKRIAFFMKQKKIPMIPMFEMEKLSPFFEEGLIIYLEERIETKRGLDIPLYKITNSLDLLEEEGHELLGTLEYVKKDNTWIVHI